MYLLYYNTQNLSPSILYLLNPFKFNHHHLTFNPTSFTQSNMLQNLIIFTIQYLSNLTNLISFRKIFTIYFLCFFFSMPTKTLHNNLHLYKKFLTPFLPFPKYKFPTQSYNILIFSNQILILHHICITHTHDSVNSLHSWL
jgi:hypothetical protein